MTQKLYDYQGVTGRFHGLRDEVRERYSLWKEQSPNGYWSWFKYKVSGETPQNFVGEKNMEEDYSHIFRRKTRKELVRISAAVMGIEFSYAAETAFVSPTLLKIGVEHQHMTLVWALSPLIGFFLTPILGSLSDRCHLNLGRRRPFIFAMALGVLLGLILVPNGETIGYFMGDEKPPSLSTSSTVLSAHRTTATQLFAPFSSKYTSNAVRSKNSSLTVAQRQSLNTVVSENRSLQFPLNPTFKSSSSSNSSMQFVPAYPSNGSSSVNIYFPLFPQVPILNATPSIKSFLPVDKNETVSQNMFQELLYNNSHPWGVFFTVLGTVLLDFDADACQSPARAYLLDVTIPEDHARGLSTFTIMAGLGGFFGYALGGINWDVTFIGELLGGHVRAVFTLTTLIFIVCISYTITSFREMPLNLLEATGNFDLNGMMNEGFDSEEENIGVGSEKSYGSLENMDQTTRNGNIEQRINKRKSIAPNPNASLVVYLQSIIYMPHSIRMLCLTNLFCWMAHVCYSLYFTDFVGEAVFGGNPTAPEGTSAREQYESGVRFGCWGMSMYSLSCACYSSLIEKFISKFGAKKVYIGGLLTYSTGMFLMALTKNKVGVILFSWTAGVMYSTLFTMPYLIVAHYHAKGVFEVNQEGQGQISSQIRGLGTDVALVSSMVFLAQFILSMCMGTIVSLSGTTTAVVGVACTLAFLGALSATKVMYLDL